MRQPETHHSACLRQIYVQIPRMAHAAQHAPKGCRHPQYSNHTVGTQAPGQESASRNRPANIPPQILACRRLAYRAWSVLNSVPSFSFCHHGITTVYDASTVPASSRFIPLPGLPGHPSNLGGQVLKRSTVLPSNWPLLGPMHYKILVTKQQRACKAHDAHAKMSHAAIN